MNVLFDFVAMCMFLFVFPCVFSPWSVVEAVPKTTPHARNVVEVCSARSFYVLELLGPFAMVLGFGLTMSPQRFSFKRASRSHAKTGFFLCLEIAVLLAWQLIWLLFPGT